MQQAQKQELIGTIITGILVDKGKDIVEKAVTKGLRKAAEKPSTDMTTADVPVAAPVVVQEVKKEVVQEAQARAEHQLDAEPHWQSRNIWGSFMVMIGAVDVIYKLWTNGVDNTPSEYWAPASIIIGGLIPLYSRFIAKKPLFR